MENLANSEGGIQRNASDPLKRILSKDKFHQLHWEENKSLAEIAKIYRTSATAVLNLKRIYGIKTNKPKKRTGAYGPVDRVARSEFSETKFRELYCDKKMTLQEIGVIFGFTRQTISKYAAKFGVERRNRSDDFGYRLNEDFFSIWTDKMAWVLGLIITDGCITRQASSLHLEFRSTDSELPEKVLRCFDSNYPVKELKPSGFSKKMQYYFQIGNKKIIADLSMLGVGEKKSLIVKLPDIPPLYFNHFLRGVFEGDGSLCSTGGSAEKPRYRANIVSGSKDFMSGLQLSIEQNYGLDGKLYKDSKREFYQLNYYKINDIRSLKKIMYENIDENMLLCRKRDKFIEFERYHFPETSITQ